MPTVSFYLVCSYMYVFVLTPISKYSVKSCEVRIERAELHYGLCLPAVAGHLPDSDRESADSSSHLGLPVPDGQYLLAGVVVFQPVSPLAATRSTFPDLLRDVRHC